jgi:hypothetical protein
LREIVSIVDNEIWNVFDNAYNVHLTLFHGLERNVNINQVKIEFEIRQLTHLLIGLHVIKIQSIKIIEFIVEIFTDFRTNVDDHIENSDKTQI